MYSAWQLLVGSELLRRILRDVNDFHIGPLAGELFHEMGGQKPWGYGIGDKKIDGTTIRIGNCEGFGPIVGFDDGVFAIERIKLDVRKCFGSSHDQNCRRLSSLRVGCKGAKRRENDRKCGSFSELAGDLYIPKVLLNDAVDCRESQTRGLGQTFGRKAWIEGM